MEAVVGYLDTTSTQPDDVRELIEPTITDVFPSVIPTTIEVLLYDDTVTPTASVVTDGFGQCSSNGQLVTDIYTRDDVCDCELGFYGDTCQLSKF